ncbi:two-component regulator propeller domain-containing protein [Ferruginibacter sp. SUN106]|uniref:two-component regulator propeller domain-containing protein n=1 Tax=Ferruginibacter sp. SUN106 TaxID=2978348 RepID=UPI003D3646D3
MSYCRLILLIGFIAAITTRTKAQESFSYSFRHLSEADGLLHKQVLAVTQDKKGFIWIATTNGLQRYDGVSFINYTAALSNPAEGLTQGIDMSADKKNDLLWIRNKNYIEKLQLGKSRFNIYNVDKILKDSAHLFNSYRESNNQEWLVSQNSVYYKDTSKKKFNFGYLDTHAANPYQSSYIALDSRNNNLWIANYRDLYLFNRKDRTVWSSTFDPAYHPLLQALFYGTRNTSVRYLMIDSRHNIWVTTWSDKLYKYDDSTKKVSTYSLSVIKKREEGDKTAVAGLLIDCMLEDDAHNIWIGTEGAGLLRYNPGKDNFDYCISSKKNNEGIEYNFKIFSLFQDVEQNIWVGTDKGISIFNPYRQYFKSIRHEEDNPLSISKIELESFIQASTGDMYIGTWGGGIAVYDQQLKFKKNIVFKGPSEVNFIWSFQQVDEQTLWIGCQHGYLLVYNILTGNTQTLHPPEMEGYTIRCMKKDNNGNILFGLHSGEIAKWDKQQQRFFSCKDSLKIPAPVTNMFIDKAQHCWIATEAGFKEFDLKKMVYINTWQPDKNNTKSISAKICTGIEEYNDSTLMIGTNNGGLNFFNNKTKNFSHINVADGLPSNNIYAIKKDAAGYVWFTTESNLYKFIYSDNKFIPYRMESGLINSPFKSADFYPLKDSQWLTFTYSEAIIFPPERTNYPGNSQSKIEITGFKIFDNPLLIDSLIYQNNPVRLSYKENFFTVEFSALNFSSLQQTNYYYRLNGIDKNWVNGGTKHFANYTDLHPGEYLFEVRAENGSNKGEVTSFRIIITPPFWKTWWFISILFVIVFLLTLVLVKWREKNIKEIAAEKLKVQQLNAEQYKSKLEMEQIINYFSSSLIDKNTVDDVLWDVAKNLIGQLGFDDCILYLWNADKTAMIQKAGFGPKGSVEQINKQPFDVLPGQGVVGFVIQSKESVVIPDTSKDTRYRPDEMTRWSEITVPVIYNNELIGVIDSEHNEKNFFTQQHLQVLNTIATLMGNKIRSIEAEQSLQQSNIEMYSMNEQLLKAKLEALRSQMNPHFIFNSLNAIDNLIQTNQKDKATTYLARFAKLIRNVLDSSKKDVVAFQKDYETLELYLQMEQFRCSDKFSYELVAEEELLHSDYKVPPLIAQPFVENAIHHGLLNKQNGGRRLTITATLETDYIKYTVEDNGVGRAKAQQLKEINKPEHISYGIDITKERIQLYNQNGANNNVIITDIFENGEPSGTRVEIWVKMV